jgi:hypothetical protein
MDLYGRSITAAKKLPGLQGSNGVSNLTTYRLGTTFSSAKSAIPSF